MRLRSCAKSLLILVEVGVLMMLRLFDLMDRYRKREGKIVRGVLGKAKVCLRVNSCLQDEADSRTYR
jgi:hypothetical protein